MVREDSKRGPAEGIRIGALPCAAFRRALTDGGLKYTPERARILDAALRLPEPFLAEALLAALREQGERISKATVYRTIKLLQQAGVLQQVALGPKESRYQFAWGDGGGALLVTEDGVERVAAAELEALALEVCRERGVRLRGARLVIYGEKTRAAKRQSGTEAE